MRNRPQRNPLHRFTVDRHLVECAANAAALARDVSRPDLLLLAALLHDIGKGWPGDHSVSGEVVARDVCKRVGLGDADVAAGRRRGPPPPAAPGRRHPAGPGRPDDRAAGRDDGRRQRTLLELLHALAAADGLATGPAAWNDWKAGLVADLVRRVSAVLDGEPDARARPAARGPARAGRRRRPGRDRRRERGHRGRARPARPALAGGRGARVAPARGPRRERDRRSATPRSRCSAWCPSTATRRTPRSSPRTCGGCSRAGSTWRTGSSAGPAPSARTALTAPPPKVTLVDNASSSATVVEVRAHDEPGLLWRIGRALGDCGLNVQAARVETLGAEAVDVFYVTDATGGLLTDPDLRKRTVNDGPFRAQPGLS